MTKLQEQLRKYFIMGSQNCDSDPLEILNEAISAGITAFQFREKGEGSLAGKAKLELGMKLRELCHRRHILFIVNDNIELVEPLQADGIHVGQEDASVNELRKQFPDKVIGLSVSNLLDFEAENTISKVDYLGIGPIFNTKTKPDAKSPIGLNLIKTLRKQHPAIPIVGIGGINTDNAASVMEAGAAGVSVISAIIKAKNIKDAVGRL